MKFLTDEKLQELTTERLLALYKKVRKLLQQTSEFDVGPQYEERLKLFVYKDDIKQILSTRENV